MCSKKLKFGHEAKEWTKRPSSLRVMAWQSVHAVIAMDIFKIQNVNVVQNAGALGSSKGSQRKIRILRR
jgi:hypothetical protein